MKALARQHTLHRLSLVRRSAPGPQHHHHRHRLACHALPEEPEELERGDDGELTADERDRLQQQLQDTALYAHTHAAPSPIGANYGEGFVNLTARGSPVRLDVDDLNEKMSVKGRLRLRHAMKPDESYGVIFCWDGVVCDTRSMQRKAWASAAETHGKTIPAIERTQMFTISPVRAVIDLLHWTRDFGEAQTMAHSVAAAYAAQFRDPEPGVCIDGLKDWLAALDSSNVPCALVSNIDRSSMKVALQKLGLERRFQSLVCAEDGMDTTSQRFLSAAIKLGRPPKQCVAFVPDLNSIAAAHNCSMRAVAVMGVHPGYRLNTADLTVGNMSDLAVYNLRKLFANADSDFMQLAKESTSHRPRRVKPTGSAVMD